MKGLPNGLKYDKKTGVVPGVPTVATLGRVVTTFTKKGAATETLEFKIAALSAGTTGMFNGFVIWDEAAAENSGSTVGGGVDLGVCDRCQGCCADHHVECGWQDLGCRQE